MPSTSQNAFPRRRKFGAKGGAVPRFAALPAAARPLNPYFFGYPFITTALKFAATRRGVPDEFILTASLPFEIPPGDPDVFQGRGDPA